MASCVVERNARCIARWHYFRLTGAVAPDVRPPIQTIAQRFEQHVQAERLVRARTFLRSNENVTFVLPLAEKLLWN